MASQKIYLSLYLNNVHGDAETERWFRGASQAAGKRLVMGKSCVRFKRVEDLPLDVIGAAVARTPVDRFIAADRASRSTPSPR